MILISILASLISPQPAACIYAQDFAQRLDESSKDDVLLSRYRFEEFDSDSEQINFEPEEFEIDY